VREYTPWMTNPRLTRGQRSQTPSNAPWVLDIAYDDIKKLMQGFIPRDMDDRWAIETISSDERGVYTTYLVRSWLRNPITAIRFRAELDSEGGLSPGRPAKLEEIIWESDFILFKPDENEDLPDDVDEVKRFTWRAFKKLLDVELPGES
jgi:hypothetical protein